MSKPRIKDIRRAYVLDILLRFAPLMEEAYPEGFPQKEILIKIIEQLYNVNIIRKYENGEFKPKEPKESREEFERKLITAISKTVNSLEKDGIINITSLRTRGKRGAHQNIINLNESPEALYSILKAYDEAVLGGGLEGGRLSFNFNHNLLTSEYYKSLVTMELVNSLTNLSELPFTDKDKELIYYLILSSPEALKILFFEVYERGSYTNKYDSEALNEFQKHLFERDGGESIKNNFIDSLQVDFIKEVKEYYDIPNFNIEININVKFKDEDGKKVYEFSNEIEGAGDNSQVNYPYINFI